MTGIERTAYDVAISFGLPSKPEASTNEKFWLIWEIPASVIRGEDTVRRIHLISSIGVVALAATIGVLLIFQAEFAQASVISANDNFADATEITNLPLSQSVNLAAATVEAGEPNLCGGNPIISNTIWYRFTPATSTIVSVDVNSPAIAIAGYTGASLDSLTHVGCASGGGQFTFNLPIGFQAGTTYYLQVGGISGVAGDTTFTFSEAVQTLPDPTNDNFADATEITNLPLSESVNLAAATVETGEPSLCGGNPIISNTIWYRFTPATSMIVSVDVNSPAIAIAGYTGASLDSLTHVGCAGGGGQFTFNLPIGFQAGTTYYLQVGGISGVAGDTTFTFSEAFQTAPVPALSQSGLAAMAMIMLGAALWGLRRKRQALVAEAPHSAQLGSPADNRP